jgi:hypothetical protein
MKKGAKPMRRVLLSVAASALVIGGMAFAAAPAMAGPTIRASWHHDVRCRPLTWREHERLEHFRFAHRPYRDFCR